jgi:type IV pilus assembly protein PilC
MAFKYQAYTPDKKIVEGTIEVGSEGMAEDALYRAGYQYILNLRETPAAFNLENLLPTLFGIRPQEVIDFSNQLATLLDSGVPILTALQLLGSQTTRKPLQRIIRGISEEVKGGNSLSRALGNHPNYFPDTYRQVIRASEQAGQLGTGLRQAALYMERQLIAGRKVKRALVYPAFILLMAVAVTILLITVALPPLVSLFQSVGAELPLVTRGLIGAGSFLLDNGLYVLAGIIIVAIAGFGLLRLPVVRLARDGLWLRLPLVGSVTVERSLAHFCRTAAMLLNAGLHLPLILEIAIQTSRNRVIRRALGRVRQRLVQGEGLAEPLAESELFPPLLTEMVAVGEKTGTMDTTFATLADFYERKVARRIDGMIAMIEPVLTVIVGIVVIFIALSMITPMYTILRSM